MHGRVSTSSDNFTLLLLHAESQVAQQQQAGGRASSAGGHRHPDVHHDVTWPSWTAISIHAAEHQNNWWSWRAKVESRRIVLSGTTFHMAWTSLGIYYLEYSYQSEPANATFDCLRGMQQKMALCSAISLDQFSHCNESTSETSFSLSPEKLRGGGNIWISDLMPSANGSLTAQSRGKYGNK